MSTIKRGRVLRDTSSGEGLVFVDGQQYPFRLEGMWRSEFAPKLNQSVDAEFDDSGKLVALRTASGAGAGGGAQASEALDAAGAAAKKMAEEFKAKGLPVIQEWAQRVGYVTLGAWIALVVAWFWLPVVSLQLGIFGGNSVSFYDSLVLVNGGMGGRGIYGFLAWVALLAVFLPQIWKDRRAGYGMMLPLALMVLIAVIAWFKSSPDTGDMGAYGNSPEFKQMMDQMRAEMWKAVSFGFGLYVAVAAALYLAFRGWQTTRGSEALSAQAA
jgi:hypothetical protein